MSNFLNFIEEDIDAKRTLISTLPTNTKANIKKFNTKIDSILNKYQEYEKALKKYLDTKNKSFNVKLPKIDIEQLTNEVDKLENIRFILNPTNTYFEKMGFDNLIYEISNYYDFTFDILNETIKKLIDKFKTAGITLKKSDFDYTCYVNEYMTTFLNTKNENNYESVAEVFEKIYWVNPEIIQHIEINFRKLIKKHEKNFNDYISNLQNQTMKENGIKDYEDCVLKLKIAYEELEVAKEENICDIVDLSKSGNIDINNYFKDSRVRGAAYSSMIIDPFDLEDATLMDKFYEIMFKLKLNVEEYKNYIKFIPLITYFKKNYEKQIPSEAAKVDLSKNLKNVELQISNKESKLEKLNKKIFNATKDNDSLKQLKISSLKEAKELYDLYKKYDDEYFKYNVMKILTSSLTVWELLNFYYSFDYFKKNTIKRVFEINKHDDVKRQSDKFNLFAMNPENVIIKGIFVFEDVEIDKVIINKYRLDNININKENLNPDDLNILLDKINFLLRINKIEKSSTTVEKIWFQTQVEKFNKNLEKR